MTWEDTSRPGHDLPGLYVTMEYGLARYSVRLHFTGSRMDFSQELSWSEDVGGEGEAEVSTPITTVTLLPGPDFNRHPA